MGQDGDIYRLADGFTPDPWRRLGDDEALPAAGRGGVIVPAARLADLAPAEVAGLGLLLAPEDRVETVAAHLAHLALVVVSFPKFNDGRAFSQARLVAERHRFTGEIRAIGEVLIDQIPLMLRVGITAFAVTHAPTRRALADGRLPAVREHYQPDAVGPGAVAGRRHLGAF
jgi:uncharacterized protein (DUF934 family)